MSPLGPLLVILPLTFSMFWIRSECRNLDGLPTDQQAVLPYVYRILQVAVAADVVWIIVTLAVQISQWV